MHPVIVETGVLMSTPAGDLKASIIGVKHYDGLAKVGCTCAMRRDGADHSKDINSIAVYGSDENKAAGILVPFTGNEGLNISANITKLGAYVYDYDLSFSAYAEVAPSFLSSFPVLSSVLLWSPTQN